MRYSYQSNILGLVQNDTAGGYRLLFWEIKNNVVNLLFLNDIEQSASCINLLFFETIKGGLQLALVERNCIKYWKFEGNKAVLTNRIYIKTPIVSASISRLTNLLCIVDELGRAVFINSMGNMVDNISHPKECFSSVFVDDIYAYFGTQSGSLCIYHLNTFKVSAVYPYLYTLRKKFLMGATDTMTEGMSGPAVNKVYKSQLSNLLAWTHADGSFVVFDCEKKKVIEFQLCHARTVESIKWIRGKKDAFISCSSDGLAIIWELLNDKWTPRVLDVSSKVSIEMSSTFYHNKGLPLKSEAEVINQRESFSVKSVEFNLSKNELLVGDMMGTLSVFDIEDYKLTRKVNLGQGGIEDMAISPRGSVLGVALSSGETILCDCTRHYQRLLVLESAYDDYTLKASSSLKRIRVIQDELERSTLFESLAENRSMLSQNRSGLVGSRTPYQKYYMKTETALKAVTVHNANTLRLQQIYRDDLTISANVKVAYCIDGKCTAFEIHPSNDYLLVVSNIGYLYVFKLVNGDMRVRINVPSLSSQLVIDPSGLYCFLCSHDSEESTKVYPIPQAHGGLDIFADKEVDMMIRNNKALDLTKVLMYEIGTGNRISVMPNLFSISAACYSDNGVYLVLGSRNGHIGIWQTNSEYANNIAEVLEQMRMNPKFWNEYPIVSTDPQLQDDESSSDSDITIDKPDELRSQPNDKTSSSKPSQIRVGNRTLNIEDKGSKKSEPVKQQRHRFFEEKTPNNGSSAGKRPESKETNIEKRFLRSRDPTKELATSSNGITRPGMAARTDKPQSTTSSSASQMPKYRVPREVLNRDHKAGRLNQQDEINRRLEILRMNAQKQQNKNNGVEVFNRSRDDQDHNIGPDPTDIDEQTEGDGRSNYSQVRNDVYSEIGQFEKRFDHY